MIWSSTSGSFEVPMILGLRYSSISSSLVGRNRNPAGKAMFEDRLVNRDNL